MIYLATTIGPIYKTITRQRRTRSVFSASYFFSYTMRKLLEQMIKLGVSEDQILTPSVDFLNDPEFHEPGCGIYPDRMIMIKQSESDLSLIQEAIDEVLKHIAEKLKDDKSSFQEKIILYLKSYLQINTIEVELNEGKETINTINRYLDNLELQSGFPSGIDEDYLIEFFERVTAHFLLRDAFGKKLSYNRFDTLEEIATRELSKIEIDNYQEIVADNIQLNIDNEKYRFKEDTEDRFYEDLENTFGDKFEPYHKYIAIVYADGDSFGKYISNLDTDATKLKDFSRQLMQFALDAKNEINTYGGTPVYIGGDDLLFFAPVVSLNEHNKKVNIFDLINTIDHSFNSYFKASPGSPTLSYGVSISYYKYPLNEANELTYALLMKAKNKKLHPLKNAIELKVLKHSGQYFDLGIDKYSLQNQSTDQSHFQLFSKLISTQIQGDQFINSLTYGMKSFEYLFEELLVKKHDEVAIKNLFDNHLDEPIHKKNKAFIDMVVHYILEIYKQQKHVQEIDLNNKDQLQEVNKRAMNIIYSTLRFINFIRPKKVKHEYA